MAIIDNAVYSFANNLDNGIPIIPFYENYKDQELKYLLTYLESLKYRDIKQINRATFKLYMFKEFECPDKLIKALFS